MLACNSVLRARSVGWFAPNYKVSSESFRELADTLDPVKESASKIDGVIRTITDGRVDFWTLDNPNAGRSRKYHLAIIDEAAFTGPDMMDIWERSIQPTLLDYLGKAVALSNANGNDPTNFLWRVCKEPQHGFAEYHGPTHQNPFMPASELARLERDTHPLVWRQEYLAEFVDFGGAAFFSSENLLVDSQPVDYPPHCETVFAVIDTAVKGGKEHDATAVSYWAHNERSRYLVCLDWDIVNIDGAMLEQWIPSVFQRCEDLAKQCHARYGSGGAWIEDAAAGAVLLQQCAMRGMPAQALPSKLTSAGKDARAINASGPVHRGEVKFSRTAFEKQATFKGSTNNQMWNQIVGFRVGDRAAATRADDLLDTFTYAVSIALGDSKGIA